jgi:hypothetical protein
MTLWLAYFAGLVSWPMAGVLLLALDYAYRRRRWW